MSHAKGKWNQPLRWRISQANFSFNLKGRAELRGRSRRAAQINTDSRLQGLLLCWVQWQAPESTFIPLRLESKINAVILHSPPPEP